MITFTYLTFILACLYASLLLSLCIGFLKLKRLNHKDTFEKLSIIVAARNEEAHIETLIQALINQKYPKDFYEIILVNDNSNDATLELMNKYNSEPNLTILSVSDFADEDIIGKKRALNIGIKKAKYEFLVFTDADCIPSENWLHEINQHLDSNTDFLTGYSPLIFKDKNLFTGLKNLERASIFAVTSSSFGLNLAITCTARNMIYRKSNWLKVNGFSSIGHIPSGDDDLMLLLQRKLIRSYNFMFTQDSIVPAIEDKDLKAQIHQETRRGSKFKYYPLYLKAICLLTFSFYLCFIAYFFTLLIDPLYSLILILFALIKIIPEFLILLIFLTKIHKKRYLIYFPLAELLYIPYFVFFGLKGSFGAYKWKN